MKANWKLFTGLSIFYIIMAIAYYYVGGEAVGITGDDPCGMFGRDGWFLYLVYPKAYWYRHTFR
jgi:hypothetical protein